MWCSDLTNKNPQLSLAVLSRLVRSPTKAEIDRAVALIGEYPAGDPLVSALGRYLGERVPGSAVSAPARILYTPLRRPRFRRGGIRTRTVSRAERLSARRLLAAIQ